MPWLGTTVGGEPREMERGQRAGIEWGQPDSDSEWQTGLGGEFHRLPRQQLQGPVVVALGRRSKGQVIDDN